MATQNNPMLTGANVEADDEHLAEFLGSDVLPPPGVWTTVRHKYQQLADTVQELNQAVRDMKRQQEGGAGGGGDDGEDSGRCVHGRCGEGFASCVLVAHSCVWLLALVVTADARAAVVGTGAATALSSPHARRRAARSAGARRPGSRV